MTITETAKTRFSTNTRKKNNKWMTDEVLDLMEEGRGYTS